MSRKFQRNIRHRWFGGVCSGFAHFIGLDDLPVRLLIRFVFVAFFPMLWWVYLLLWIVLPAQKLYEPEELLGQHPKAVYRPRVKVDVTRLEFDDVVAMAGDKVSERVFEKVINLDASVRALIPHLTWWRILTQPEFRSVKRAALEYFPQRLQRYLNLPRDYAEKHRLANGVTPEAQLLDELAVLQTTLDNVLESISDEGRVSAPEDLTRLYARFSTNESPSADIGDTLDGLVRRIRGEVSNDILERAISIRATIVSVLPQITEMGAGMTQDAYNLRQTALGYLPDALEKYLRLPEGFAETQVLSGGKTAKEALLEQLELLDETVKNIAGDVYQEDAEALLVHGRFLKEKFADQTFTLPPDEPPKKLLFPDLSKVREKEKVRGKS